MARAPKSEEVNHDAAIRRVRARIGQEMEFNEFKLSRNKHDYQYVRELGAGTYGSVSLMQYDSRNDTASNDDAAPNSKLEGKESDYTEYYAIKSV